MPDAAELSPEQVGQLAQVGALTNALWQKDPEFRKRMQETVKKNLPHVAVPELDAARAAEAAVQPHVEEIGKLRNELAERDIRDRTERAWGKHNLSAEDRSEVEKVMGEKLIGDIDTAVQFVQQGRKLAEPRPGRQTLGLPTGPNFKGLLKNPDGWARDEALRAVADIEAGRDR